MRMLRSLELILRLAAIAAVLALPLLVTPAAAQQDNTQSDQLGDELFTFAPDSPERLVRAAELSVGLRRYDLARGYLRKILDQPLTDEVAMQLRGNFGIDHFIALNTDQKLYPEANELLSRINAAVRQATVPDASMVQLIGQLGADRRTSVDAALQILSQRDNAVTPLLQADTSTPSGQMADQLLQRYADQFATGLVNALPNSDAAQKERILNLLRGSGNRSIAAELLVYEFTGDSDQVRQAAKNAVDRLWKDSGRPATAVDAANWLNQKTMELLQAAGENYGRHSGADAHWFNDVVDHQQENANTSETIQRAATLGQCSALIAPNNETSVVLADLALAAQNSWPLTWPAPAATLDKSSEVSVATLYEIALRSRNAAVLLAVMNARPELAELEAERPELVTQLLNTPDPRVRLAAALNVIDNTQHPGTIRRAAEVIAAASDSTEEPRAVVIDSRNSAAQSVASVVGDLGFSTAAATSGQEGTILAGRQLHCDLILIHANCLNSSLSNTVANLKADTRSSSSPIIIYGSERDRSAAQSLARLHNGIWFLTEPLSADTLRESLKLEHITAPLLTAAERLAMIQSAESVQSEP